MPKNNFIYFDWDTNTNEIIYGGDLHEILGYSKGEMKGGLSRWEELIHPADRKYFETEIMKLMRTTEPIVMVYRVMRKNGVYRRIEFSGLLMSAVDGDRSRVVGLIKSFEDVRRKGKDLQRERDFLMGVMEAVVNPLYVIDAESYRVLMSNWAARVSGVEVGCICYRATHGKESPCGGMEHVCPIGELKRTKKPLTVEHIHKGKDGSPRFVEISAYPVFDEKHQVSKVIEYVVDVTDRKQTEVALKENVSLMKSIIESIADGIIIVGNDGRIVLSNNRFAQMWLVPKGMMESGEEKRVLDHMAGQLVNAEAFLARVRDLHGSCEHGFDTILLKDGRAYERLSSPLLRDGQPAGCIWSFRDVTVRKAGED